ncbi:MAG: ACP S-malonyltransferase [Victivallaceae bacterium]|nr:ACP S-malonyltransferase [Victivallaceae bacterium]
MKPFFVFSGQGAQTVGMGRDLAENSAAARRIFEEADAILGRRLSDVIWSGPIEDLTRSTNCQTAIYTVSCAALAAFREKHSCRPVACAGLSLGEYGALYAAGAFDFGTGLKLLDRRGALMDEACRLHPGAMASVIGAETAVVEEVCREIDLDVANYNCPGQIVISGPREKIDVAAAQLREKGVKKIVPLAVAGGFHSRLMREAGDKLRDALAAAEIRTPETPVLHNYTADFAGAPDAIRAALAAQVSGSVRWEACLRRAVSECGADAVIEFGPGSVLTNLARRTLPELVRINVNDAASLAQVSIE